MVTMGDCQMSDDTCNNYVVSTCQICENDNIINKLNPEESYYLLTFINMMDDTLINPNISGTTCAPEDSSKTSKKPCIYGL